MTLHYEASFCLLRKEKNMSTRSNVSILSLDGSVTTQYFHMDGALTFTGQNLLNYRTLDDAKKLIEAGNYTDLHIPETPAAATKLIDEYNSNGQRIDDPARKKYTDLSAMIDDISKNDGKYLNSDVEYHYLFSPNAEGTYQWHTINRNGIKLLTQKVIDSEKESGVLADVNWNKSSATSEWAAPLTNEEKKGLNEGLDKQNKALESYQKYFGKVFEMNTQDKEEKQEVINEAAKAFTSDSLSAKWYLQNDKAVNEALDNAYSDNYSKDHKESENLKKLENQLTDKQVKYFNELYDATRDNSLAASNVSLLPKDVENQISEKASQLPSKSKENSKTKSKGKFDKATWKKQHDQTVKELKEGLLKEVETYTQTPEQVLEFLDFTDKFHQYSTRNSMLIHMQRPSAVAVGSFKKFKDMGYSVKKGEKGIKLFVPTQATVFYRQDKDGNKTATQLKNATQEEKQKIKDGSIKTQSKTFYKIGTVFDATQTNMPKEKYPELYPNRHQDFDMKNPRQLDLLEKGLRSVANDMKMPVVTYNSFDTEIRDKYKDPQNAKGYFNRATNEIVLNGNNTPTENVSVLAHELGHAQLHNSQKQEKELPRPLKEMQAEMTSYLYCKRYGIDTKKETISYIADWTDNGKDFNKLPSGVKGQILTHVSAATDKLTTSTDKVINQEHERIDQIAKENFLDTPKHAQWYTQRQKMEEQISNNETNGWHFDSEIQKTHNLEDKMSKSEVAKLESAFAATQEWTENSNYSLVSPKLEKEIQEKAAEDKTELNNKQYSQENYQTYLLQQGLER